MAVGHPIICLPASFFYQMFQQSTRKTHEGWIIHKSLQIVRLAIRDQCSWLWDLEIITKHAWLHCQGKGHNCSTSLNTQGSLYKDWLEGNNPHLYTKIQIQNTKYKIQNTKIPSLSNIWNSLIDFRIIAAQNPGQMIAISSGSFAEFTTPSIPRQEMKLGCGANRPMHMSKRRSNFEQRNIEMQPPPHHRALKTGV